MAYLKRVLNPIQQIKFVYITNTYKALLREKSIYGAGSLFIVERAAF